MCAFVCLCARVCTSISSPASCYNRQQAVLKHLEQEGGHLALALDLTGTQLLQLVVAVGPGLVDGRADLDAHREGHGLHPVR